MAISLLVPLLHGFGSFGGHPSLRGVVDPPLSTILSSIQLAFSSGRHSFSRTLTLGAGDEQTAGGLLKKVGKLINIEPELLVLWNGDVLLDEVRPRRTRTI